MHRIYQSLIPTAAYLWTFFLGSIPHDYDLIKVNGAIFCLCAILELVMVSAAEEKLGALFLNCKEGKVICITLTELGHSQSPTPVHNNMVK